MKVSIVLLGYKGFYTPDNANGKTNQPLVKIKIPVFLRNSAVPCSKFDIHFFWWRSGILDQERMTKRQQSRVKS